MPDRHLAVGFLAAHVFPVDLLLSVSIRRSGSVILDPPEPVVTAAILSILWKWFISCLWGLNNLYGAYLAVLVGLGDALDSPYIQYRSYLRDAAVGIPSTLEIPTTALYSACMAAASTAWRSSIDAVIALLSPNERFTAAPGTSIKSSLALTATAVLFSSKTVVATLSTTVMNSLASPTTTGLSPSIEAITSYDILTRDDILSTTSLRTPSIQPLKNHPAPMTPIPLSTTKILLTETPTPIGDDMYLAMTNLTTNTTLSGLYILDLDSKAKTNNIASGPWSFDVDGEMCLYDYQAGRWCYNINGTLVVFPKDSTRIHSSNTTEEQGPMAIDNTQTTHTSSEANKKLMKTQLDSEVTRKVTGRSTIRIQSSSDFFLGNTRRISTHPVETGSNSETEQKIAEILETLGEINGNTIFDTESSHIKQDRTTEAYHTPAPVEALDLAMHDVTQHLPEDTEGQSDPAKAVVEQYRIFAEHCKVFNSIRDITFSDDDNHQVQRSAGARCLREGLALERLLVGIQRDSDKNGNDNRYRWIRTWLNKLSTSRSKHLPDLEISPRVLLYQVTAQVESTRSWIKATMSPPHVGGDTFEPSRPTESRARQEARKRYFLIPALLHHDVRAPLLKYFHRYRQAIIHSNSFIEHCATLKLQPTSEGEDLTEAEMDSRTALQCAQEADKLLQVLYEIQNDHEARSSRLVTSLKLAAGQFGAYSDLYLAKYGQEVLVTAIDRVQLIRSWAAGLAGGDEADSESRNQLESSLERFV